MAIRRIIGYFLVFLFVIVALPAFLSYSLAKTFLDPAFYVGPFAGISYDLVINVVTKNLYQKDPTLQRHFQIEDLQTEIKNAFSSEQFQKIMDDFSQQLEKLRTEPDKPLILNLKSLRAGLLMVAQRMSSKLFASFPQCNADELPQFSEEGLATCVPKGVDFNIASGPVAKQFEKVIYDTLPDQVDLSFSKDGGNLFLALLLQWVSQVKLLLFGALIVLVVLIAFVIHKPFSAIIRFEGKAFLGSGLEGFLLSLGLGELPQWLFSAYQVRNEHLIEVLGGRETILKYFQYVFGFFTNEIYRLSIIFMLLGAFLTGIYFYLKRSHGRSL